LGLFFFWGSLTHRSDKATSLSVSKSANDEREGTSIIALNAF
jgi:hypothetical protein